VARTRDGQKLSNPLDNAKNNNMQPIHDVFSLCLVPSIPSSPQSTKPEMKNGECASLYLKATHDY